MLSRTADNLYWMGRSMERAEDMARILDVTRRTVLMPHAGQAASEWRNALGILGDPAAFAGRYGEPDEEGVIAYLTLDPDNPSSIYSSVRNARENARSLRATISTEMWETLNATWLELRDIDRDRLQHRGLGEFFDWIKERSHLFRGVSYTTTLHNGAFHFLRLGTFLERADTTARLLDTKAWALVPGQSGQSDGAAYYEWGAVLRAVSAFRAYHQVYHDVIAPARVAELLVLRPDMPRSLRFCYDQVVTILDLLSERRNLECQRLAGEMHARLRFGRMERLMTGGLHGFLSEVIGHTASLSEQVARDFMMTV